MFLVKNSRDLIDYNITFAGFRSYVGHVVSVMRTENMIDLEYEECGTDEEEVEERCCFSPWMFHNLAPINKYQMKELMTSKMHFSFNPHMHKLHRVILV